MPLKISVYIATSLDGFIARDPSMALRQAQGDGPGGDLDWLPAPNEGEDYGYAAFWASVDALVMGRGTFEKVLSFPEWPYGDKPVYLLSHRPLKLLPGMADRVRVLAGSPREVMQRLVESGAKHVYLDGGKTIQGFLREGLVDELTLTRVPVLLGSGIPLFGSLENDIHLHHLETKAYPNGLVQSKYEVER
jgi:dihydrofolate reductase